MTNKEPGAPLASSQRARGQDALYAVLGRYSLVIILALLIVGFSIARPQSFFTINNFQGIFINQIVVVFAAIGLHRTADCRRARSFGWLCRWAQSGASRRFDDPAGPAYAVCHRLYDRRLRNYRPH